MSTYINVGFVQVSRQVHDDRNEDQGETITSTTTEKTTSTTTTSRPTRATTKTTTTRTTTTPYDDYDDRDDNEIDDGDINGDGKTSGSEETTTKSTVTINYDGDYDTVDDHRRKFNVTTNEEDQLPVVPDICQGQFDAVSVLRNELFFFKNQVSRMKSIKKNNNQLFSLSGGTDGLVRLAVASTLCYRLRISDSFPPPLS